MIIVSAMILAASLAYPFEIKIHNNTDHKMMYNLIWIDCDWYGPIRPASMAKGEIQPHTVNDMEVDYLPGDYGVIWDQYDKGQSTRTEVSRFRIQVPSSKGLLISKPLSLIFYPGT
jgi:hypothetical protein